MLSEISQEKEKYWVVSLINGYREINKVSGKRQNLETDYSSEAYSRGRVERSVKTGGKSIRVYGDGSWVL